MEYYIKDDFGNFYSISNLDIKESDTIIMKYDEERTDVDSVRMAFDGIKNSFSKNRIICIPSSMQIGAKGEENEDN